MKQKPYIEDFDFSKREYRRRKHSICFLGSIVDQLLYEGGKLAPAAEHFHKMNDDEKRRYTEAITAIHVWLDNMKELAYGEDAEPDEERQDKNEY